MTVVGGERRRRRRPPVTGEIDQLKQLVEIQSQIVEVAKQNELTEKECEALRHELAQSARRPPRPRFAGLVRGWLRRLSGGNGD